MITNTAPINNIKPRTREEREALKNKEAIEKTRINQRVGYEARNIDMKSLLHQADPQSDLYCPENVRFDKDFAMYEKRRRDQEFNTKNDALEQRRAEKLNRESEKWLRMDQEFDHANQILENKKKTHSEAGTYSNGMAFNPITLEYHEGNRGEKLKQIDDHNQFRAKIRAKNLDLRSNTGYNILTGEDRRGVDISNDVFLRYAENLIVPKRKNNNPLWG